MSNQFTPVVDEDTEELLIKLASVSGVPVSGIISRILGASMSDLTEYLTWMLSIEGESDLYFKGQNLLVSYGPEDLMSGIRRLDSNFISTAERLATECRVSSSQTLNNEFGDHA